MSEGEHTIITRIPRERLNQIAGRKLSALAIPVRLGADRESLEGELTFALGRITHPSTGQPVARARFAVEGHDRLRFVDPPLADLGPIPFGDVERASTLEHRVAEQLAARRGSLDALAAQLRALGVATQAEPNRLAARAVVTSGAHAFELRLSPDGVRVSRVAERGGRPWEVPEGFAAVRLQEHPSATDLALWLHAHLPDMEAAARASAVPPAATASAPSEIQATPAPANALTLGALVRAFGEDAVLAPNAPLELFREFRSGETHYRFVASRDYGAVFAGRIIGPARDLWSGRFDLATFPGALQTAAQVLSGSKAAAEEVAPSGSAPRAGDVWVMKVLVEAVGEDEVRYVNTGIDGRPYGAARVLKRSEFEAVFSPGEDAWRLFIVIDQVSGDGVIYRQLDPQGSPVGAPRRMATSVLVANFAHEATRP